MIICFPVNLQKLYTIFIRIARPICVLHKNPGGELGKIGVRFAYLHVDIAYTWCYTNETKKRRIFP